MLAEVDISGVYLETPRMILRPWRILALDDLNAYASVPGVGEMAGWSYHRSGEESLKILEMFIREKKTLALELKENGKVIGSLGLENFSPQDIHGVEMIGREIGYVLSRDYWGRGLMAEAVKAVMEYCFSVLCYDYLTCSHFLQNHQSRRVIEKCGFCFVKESSFDTQYGTREITRYYVKYNPKQEREGKCLI